MPPCIQQTARFLFWTIPCLLVDAIRLIFFVVCLLPAWLRFIWYYAIASHRQSVRYGQSSLRQTLDVYCLDRTLLHTGRLQYEQHGSSASPAAVPLSEMPNADLPSEMLQNDEDQRSVLLQAPVVVFCTGGAWMIGYKMWGALLARALTAAGIVVVIPDYRNYPWGTVPEMCVDVKLVLEWTNKNVHLFGGDPDKVVLVGQSAGGHLGCTTLLRRAISILSTENSPTTSTTNAENEGSSSTGESGWIPRERIQGFISLSGPTDLVAMERTLMKHGLDRHIVDRIFGGNREEYNPMTLIQSVPQEQHSRFAELLPPIQILHGTADNTVPHDGSKRFASELEGMIGSDRIMFASYEGWSHTDPILEAPMAADHKFHIDVFQAVQLWTGASNIAWPAAYDPIVKKSLCPKVLIQIARWCNPF